LESRKLGSWKDFEGNHTTDEGLEERGSQEGAIAQDVVCFVVADWRHVDVDLFRDGKDSEMFKILSNGISRQIARVVT
jgi:hypothetical protein